MHATFLKFRYKRTYSILSTILYIGVCGTVTMDGQEDGWSVGV